MREREEGGPTTPEDEVEALLEAWPTLPDEERVAAFRRLPRVVAGQFFLERSARTQATLLRDSPPGEQRLLMRLLAPDDAADVLQEMEPEERAPLLALLDDRALREVSALLAYQEDEAGGLMSPRFVRVRPDMSVEEAIRYVRLQARERPETIYYVYVLDADQRLLGVLSFRELFSAAGERPVREVMHADVVTIGDHEDQEQVARLIAQHDVLALPVVDEAGRMRGIVTVDDIVDVVQDEATEDIQKAGGMEALDEPYFRASLGQMLRKRAGWLALLFIGEMFVAHALGFFEHDIQTAVVLAFFLPLIISSGGNSGSQASTLVVRAMALGQVRLRDWWRVMRRELLTGLALGGILAGLGIARILLGEAIFGGYGEHAALLALTVGLSVIGVVVCGTFAGSMLPFVLRRIGFDPASASAPLVATLVDLAGVVIYFGVARLVLAGTLL